MLSKAVDAPRRYRGFLIWAVLSTSTCDVLVNALCSADACHLYRCEHDDRSFDPAKSATSVSLYNPARNIMPDSVGMRCIEANANKVEADGTCR